MNGGVVSVEVPAGVAKYPEAERLKVDISVERGVLGAARPSLFLVTSRKVL